MKQFLPLILAAWCSAAPAFTSVCERAAPIRDFVVKTLKKPCTDITEADLSMVKRIAAPRKNITELKLSDLDDLPNLEILNIKFNKLTTLPDGIFSKLPNLKTLVLLGNPIRELPDDFLEANPLLENLHLFFSPFRTISESVFARLEAMQHLRVIDISKTLNPAEAARLRKLFPAGGKVRLTFI